MRDDADPPPGGPPPRREILRERAFALFFCAATLRSFGASISSVGLQLVIVTVVAATPAQIGVINALGVAPYLALGLVVGALMDRWRRQPTLVATSLARAVVLGLVPLLIALDALSVWAVAGIVLALGVLTLFADSAAQPFLPHLVPREQLVAANARLSQSTTVATTAGPALGGALVRLLGAPLLFALDAVVCAVAALLQARIRVSEPPPAPPKGGRHLGREIADGLRYTYRHPTLRPLALSIHLWFLGNGIVTTVFAVYVLRELGLSAWGFALALSCAGIGGFLGALAAPGLGRRLGVGRAILLGRTLSMIAWAPLALTPPANLDHAWAVGALACTVQLIYGLGQGIEDANDTGYRQSVALDAMQGRMNATIRTANRSVFLVGALAAGLLATMLDYRWTLAIAVFAFGAAAAVVAASPLRRVRLAP